MRSTASRRAGLILIAAIAVGWPVLALVPRSGASDSSGPNGARGSIALASDRGLYRRYPNGRLMHLTTDGHDTFPAWSRSGKQIAFVRGDLRQRFFCPLFIMNSDGTASHQVGQVKTDCSGVSWGPGDQQIVFGGAPVGGNNATLWVVNVDGTGLRRLLRGAGANPPGTHPVWSPNGRMIVFAWTAGSRNVDGLAAIRPDGSGLQALVKPSPHHLNDFAYPAWSQDGKRLAFVHEHFLSYTTTLEVANADGQHPHTLARWALNPGEQGTPSWSPNGLSIVFWNICGRYACVSTIPSQGGRRHVLLRSKYLEPSWGPAGT